MAASPLRIVFCGTPEFAVPCLDMLAASRHQVAAVYTQPDRPAGRGRKLTASPVKARALALGIPVRQPKTLRTEDVQMELAGWNADLMVVVAYGLILPPAVLALPTSGCINVHASLLPRWRGAAPIQRAILAGDSTTGITIMQMDAGLDTGPMLLRKTCRIAPEETGGSLHDRLATLGASALMEALEGVVTGNLHPQPQPADGISYAAKLDKSEARIQWNHSAIAIERQVRAFNPWPVAQTVLEGETLRVWKARALEPDDSIDRELTPGTVVEASRGGIKVATGQGVLELLTVQLPGGRQISAQDLINSRDLSACRLGETG
ncbi:MAG: methionyl-tRNA formyltransferase [Pseudomonadota bacterium]|nr:methionyl-tRNA formyltransferase [Pseudomonadota bacterium]